MCSSIFGFIFWKTTSLLSHDLLSWLTNCSTLCCSLFSLSYLDLLLLAFPWYSWLFVSIVLLQFDSQSPSLSSNDSFSFLFNFFFNYLNFSFISFIGCTGFLRLFVCFCCLFCFVSSLLFSFLCPHVLHHCYVIHFFLWFSGSFCFFLLYLLIAVCICFHFVSISFEFGYYIGPLCVFFFCLYMYFTQFNVVEKINGSLSYTIWFM